eukprot:6590949-Karenia_brevis.AAC.1
MAYRCLADQMLGGQQIGGALSGGGSCGTGIDCKDSMVDRASRGPGAYTWSSACKHLAVALGAVFDF